MKEKYFIIKVANRLYKIIKSTQQQHYEYVNYRIK